MNWEKAANASSKFEGGDLRAASSQWLPHCQDFCLGGVLEQDGDSY